MIEQTVPATLTTEPRAWKKMMHAAAAKGPTAVDGTTGAVHVLRHMDIEALLRDPRVRGAGLSLFDAMGIDDGPLRSWYGELMFTNEGKTHDRLRRLVSKAFTPRSVEKLRPFAAARVAERLDSVRRAGGGDLVDLLGDVPMQVMCSLVGVPGAAVPEFVGWVDALSPVFGFMEPAQVDAATAAITELLDYLAKLVEQRGQAPAADILSSLVAAEHDGDRLTRDETVTMVANLLVAGHDTTASQIGCSLLTLLARPSVMKAVAAAPSSAPAVLTETIRFDPSITAAMRTVVEPLEVGGVDRPAGTVLMCNFLTANRDPGVWDDGDSFRPERFADPHAPRLLSFGGGPHFCLGAALARMTLEETVRAVCELAPTLVGDPDGIGWVQVLGRSPERLPVKL